MYKRKLPLDLSCGIRIVMSIIGSKWKPCLIDALRESPKRPSELHREIPDAVSRVLNQNLRELEEHGIVEKKIFAELPPHSEYALTELGKSLLPIIDSMDDWGERNRPTFEKLML
ncbi:MULTISPECIES: helix-turn-helix domain-containing protein [unclassified Parabacteroides]|uniref:winged helix-turn-helix transcriptional regulator n=1 Tax=unclassified Parabacteroides TaxID=2649774 RepID=UPI0024743626|nr:MULTISPECIES: helix-turn-helix domain-containing protein [unclassified Parabacteroides]